MYIFSLLYTVFKINNIVFSMFLYILLKKYIKLKKYAIVCKYLSIFWETVFSLLGKLFYFYKY